MTPMDIMRMTRLASSSFNVSDRFNLMTYSGTGAARTLSDGLTGRTGGTFTLELLKARSGVTAGTNSVWAAYDGLRGATVELQPSEATAQTTQAQGLTAFNEGGSVDIGTRALINASGGSFLKAAFLCKPGFFDIVSYTGSGTTPQTIAHALGSVPGMIWVKSVATANSWYVWHKGLANNQYIVLDTTAAVVTSNTVWNNTAPTSSVFSVGNSTLTNNSGTNYIAYVFGSDYTSNDVIKCGSATLDASGNASVNLGWEPQAAIVRIATIASTWSFVSTLQGWDAASCNRLSLDSNALEANVTTYRKSATGFDVVAGAGAAGEKVIYMAIRKP